MPTPHDKLVHRAFDDLQHARGLLRGPAPSGFAPRIDRHALALVDGRFIDPQLVERPLSHSCRCGVGRGADRTDVRGEWARLRVAYHSAASLTLITYEDSWAMSGRRGMEAAA